MPETFEKDLSHLTWDEVYSRQIMRAPLVADWMEALRLKAGDRVLDVGCGPGYVALLIAERIGPTGVVYALDRSAEALAYLARLQKERGIANVQRLVADAAALQPIGLHVDAALITMVLHHAEDPAGIVQNVAGVLKPQGLAVIAEFDPDGPCEQGPPRRHRLYVDRIRTWCEKAGFMTLDERQQTSEHYMVVVQRRD